MASTKASQTDRNDRRYMSAAMDAPLLEREHEVSLARRWLDRRDEAALHELVTAHVRLVVRIAVGFRRSGLPVADLIQEGNIGLMEAAGRFDPERAVRFSTYASWWIVAAIQSFILRNSSIVRAATSPKQRQLYFSLRRLRAKAGAGPDVSLSDEERRALAERVGASLAEVERMEGHVARPDQSLNTVVGVDESAEIQDLIADPAPTPDQIVEEERGRHERSAWIRQALATLSPRERHIVERRFLAEQKPKLSDLGVAFGITKERVRQIEARAIVKLKAVLTELAGGTENLAAS
jgi:RNA polymerase sigma-32 factor